MALVNQAYSLSDKAQLNPATGTAQNDRVLKECEIHFALLPPELPEFNHFKPAAHLLENRPEILAELPGLDLALERFERLFSDLNMLPSEEAKSVAKAAKA